MLGAAVNGLLRLSSALAALSLLSCGFYYPASDPGTGSMPEDRAATAPRFHSTVDAALSWWLATHPTEAGALGIHDYDGQLDRVSKTDLASRVEALKKQLFRLGAALRDDLPDSDHADAEVLELRLRAELHEIETVREWARNPGYYRSLLAEALHLPASQDFDTAERRLGSVCSRLEQVGGFLDAAKANLEQPPKLLTEIAIEEFAGLRDFVKTGLPAAFEGVKDPALRRRFEEARTPAVEALSKFVDWLQQELLPKSTGSFALGAEALATRLRLEAGVDDSLETLRERGRTLLKRTQEELKQLAGDRPIREALRALGQDRPAAADLIPTAQGMVERLNSWSSSQMTLPSDTGCRVQETPEFRRALSFASLQAPGPFEKAPGEGRYSLTLPSKDWPVEKQAQHLAFFSRPALLLISAHETYPGHYAQGVVRRSCPSRVRKTFASGIFLEGWAHYSEELIVEAGLAPEFRLVQRALAQLRICRYIAALELHTQGMTPEQAAALFETEAFLEPAQAVREARRAAADPMVLVYTLGKQQILDLRDAWRAETGGSLREFHDALLALGAPPLRIARRLLLKGR